MLQILNFLTVLFACLLGTICGMGGGVIIKPMMDAVGRMNISTINFLSGCTVLSMASWNIGKALVKKESAIDLHNTTLLGIGAAAGGLTGKQLFKCAAALFVDSNAAGGIQAALLLTATLATLIYTMKKESIRSRQVKNPLVIFFLGFLLGNLGSFLGIGGGPFNVALLCYFFSMSTKKAAQNSLYIIVFSQIAATAKTIIVDGIPSFPPIMLIGMVFFAILGSEIGRYFNQKIEDGQITHLFEGTMVLIMGLTIYNMVKYLH